MIEKNNSTEWWRINPSIPYPTLLVLHKVQEDVFQVLDIDFFWLVLMLHLEPRCRGRGHQRHACHCLTRCVDRMRLWCAGTVQEELLALWQQSAVVRAEILHWCLRWVGLGIGRVG